MQQQRQYNHETNNEESNSRITMPTNRIARILEDYVDSEALRIASAAQPNDNLQSASINVAAESTANDQADYSEFIKELDLPTENLLLQSFFEKIALGSNDDRETLVHFTPVTFPDPDEIEDRKSNSGSEINEQEEENEQEISIWSTLTDHIIEHVFWYLDQDSLDMAKLVCRRWYSISTSEKLWKSIVMSVFLPPAYRPIVLVDTGNGIMKPQVNQSWFLLGKRRPRLRQQFGVYILRKLYVRDPGPKTMWSTEYSPVCQCFHYRYFLFLPRGELYYASTPHPIHQMIARFRDLALHWGNSDSSSLIQGDSKKTIRKGRNHWKNKPKVKTEFEKSDKIFYGSYSVSNSNVHAIVNQVDYSVAFTMHIDKDRNGAFDRLLTVSHQYMDHRDRHKVMDFPLSHFYSEKLWRYHSFDYFD